MTSVSRKWTDKEDALLRRYYLEKTRTEIGTMLGRSKGSIRKRCSVLGLNYKHPAVTPAEFEMIREWYTDPAHSHNGSFGLDDLALQLGRTKQFISRLARKMGLTNSHRPVEKWIVQAAVEGQRRYVMMHGHPRGMLGKKHTDDARERMRANNGSHSMTAEQLHAKAVKSVATRITRYGTGRPNALAASNAYSRTKSGKRIDLGGQFFRSSWEANYARYLNFLIEQGVITQWRYESKTFVFEGLSSGVRSYTPDFEVWRSDGTHEWHEVKGWMDISSQARLKCMGEYHPEVRLIVIDSKAYRELEREMKGVLPNWEGRNSMVTPQEAQP